MAKTTRSAKNHRTGIYVDVQNLQEIARELLSILISRWPDVMPKPSALNLYVRADHQQLWRVWATHQFSDLEVTVKGVQHYSLAATKNAADMAIAVDAIADLLHDRISHVAVVSDDSDFIALFAKLAEEVEDQAKDLDRAPFLWVLTDRRDTKSALLKEFFPWEYLHVVDRSLPPVDFDEDIADDESQDLVDEPADETVQAAPDAAMPLGTVNEQIALLLVREMPVGKSKSTDCQYLIREDFPEHTLSGADGPAFGQIFRREILPILEDWGCREIGNQRPRQYEITHEAKRMLSRD
ncbi:MAG: NYN domain-containing protein [SAR202 cluster bacterium]|nr:NYN domain-containing protein [SAR202 cluster bacterium]HAL47674.1 hypothetical protein [Dehalococcoidia bacterium]MDP6663559.1 NYN domain-containing protein [SAR202 cluster bacterium]MDP6800719.1 NYN domain-containing protein [SAR202 cluster bacterium]MQG57006.1 NYN domain-containing protein [SAR202 cluster bacterium]|tara:strand:- start:5070 stop:5957 length:888 start_codon:yes stop_codon:yes gene_type:complete